MPFNKLNDAEDERLSLLSEECAEVIQIIQKIQRHGYESYHPDDDVNNVTTNRQLLEIEIGHVKAALELMLHETDVRNGFILEAMHVKLGKVGQYLHHQSRILLDTIDRMSKWYFRKT